ncbi:MAG: GNAT family N-acetyltransferase, partial [Bacteroidota bacterium]
MKIFYSENTVDYSSYTFNYAIYCMKETQEELPAIYDKGFLPYTGNILLEKELFYLARSLRVDLDRFEDSSENRRVGRKIAELDIQLEVISKEDFDIENATFVKFCAAYAADRFSGGAMPEDRLRYVLKSNIATHLVHFYNEQQTMGYVLACMVGGTLHYWYAFFDTAYMKSHSLGKWMMWRTIRWAKDEGLQHVYLGTCYGHHSLYKVRDHKGLAFFDGSGWNQDAKLLKQLCKTDAEGLD